MRVRNLSDVRGWAAIATVVAAVACSSQPAAAQQKARKPIVLDASHSALKHQFNRDARHARLVVLVSPT